MRELARRELAAPVQRVSERVLEAIDALSPSAGSAGSPAWQRALAATRALAAAPQHHLRTQLVLIGDLAAGGAGEGEAVEALATGVELLHLFMLVHDDVIDESVMRRGQPAVHVALSSEAPAIGREDARNLAIVVGNLLHVLGMEWIVRSDPSGAATRLLLEASRRTGVGQFEDVVGWRGRAWGGGGAQGAHLLDGRDEFRRLMEDKSALQTFAAPLAAGLLRARPEADTRAVMDWGRRMGVALQAADDLIDLVGDPRTTGKDNFRDIVEGRLSLAVLLLRERATDEDGRALGALLGARALMPSDRRSLGEMIDRYQVVAACRAFIEEELAAAVAIADGAGLPEPARAALAAIEAGLHVAVSRIG